MPDLTGLTALDVAIGLAFAFFLVSVLCSTIHELIAAGLGWRAQDLEKAIRHWLASDGESAQDAEARGAAFFDSCGSPRWPTLGARRAASGRGTATRPT
jgi:hypothetical protein